MTKATLRKESFMWGFAYSFSPFHHGRKKIGMVLEQKLRALHLDPQTVGERHCI